MQLASRSKPKSQIHLWFGSKNSAGEPDIKIARQKNPAETLVGSSSMVTPNSFVSPDFS